MRGEADWRSWCREHPSVGQLDDHGLISLTSSLQQTCEELLTTPFFLLEQRESYGANASRIQFLHLSSRQSPSRYHFSVQLFHFITQDQSNLQHSRSSANFTSRSLLKQPQRQCYASCTAATHPNQRASHQTACLSIILGFHTKMVIMKPKLSVSQFVILSKTPHIINSYMNLLCTRVMANNASVISSSCVR